MPSATLYLAILKKIGPFSLLIFINVCISNCQNKKQKWQWDSASIDPTIVNNYSYKQLDKESEVFSVFENQDSTLKRTSGVAYFTNGNSELSDSNYAILNNCRAHFSHSDTLFIKIGFGDGFVGKGFIINYKDKKFYTEPYYFTDLIIEGETLPVYELIYQKLTLDKPKYKVGDSLYGKIDFKSIEIDQARNKINHSGKGYFRTKIKEL